MSDVWSDWASFLPTLLEGLGVSLRLALVALVIALPLALGLALLVMSDRRVPRWIGLVIVEAGRGMPALVILYLVYYGLPRFGFSPTSWAAATIGLSWNMAAYASEMIRAGIQSVPRGQVEAATALGLSGRSTFGRIVLPQGLRLAIPGLMGQTIMMFQDTSLAYTIAVPELMKSAYSLGSQSFQYLRVFTLAGLLYAAITVPSTWLTVYFERRLARGFTR